MSRDPYYNSNPCIMTHVIPISEIAAFKNEKDSNTGSCMTTGTAISVLVFHQVRCP